MFVDGNNVMGSRADGWWRNRAEAAERLVAEIAPLARDSEAAWTIVFDGPGPPGMAPPRECLTVVHTGHRRRNGADDRIVELVDALPDRKAVLVYTSDAGFVPGCTHWARRLQVPGRFWTNSPRRATQWSRAPAAAHRWRPSAAWSNSAAWTGRSSRRRGCGKSNPAARIPIQSVCGRGSVLNCHAVPKEVTDGQIIEKICIRFDDRL